MNFKPELAEKVMAGTKTVTRRLVNENPNSPWWMHSTRWPVGKRFTINPGRGKPNIGHAVVLDASIRQLGYPSLAECQAEGLASLDEFTEVWKAINHGYNIHSLVWRIRFEVST